jgi:hypothetical protein
MQKKSKQKVALRLRHKDRHGKEQWVVKYGRLKKDGTVGWSQTPWVVRAHSWQPKPVFFAIVNSIFHYTNKIPKPDKCFESMEPKIRVALSEAAPLCGCGFKKNKFGGLTWILDGRPFMDFAVVNYEKHRDEGYEGSKGLMTLAEKLRPHRRKVRYMERKSSAMFRVAIVVLKNGVWKFVPGKTLPKEKRHG